MDMMTIRKMVMGQMAGAKIKSGSFVGNGTKNATISIGFEPDVLVIETGIDYTTSSYSGLLSLVLVRGCGVFNNCKTGTATTASTNANIINVNDDPWGVKESYDGYYASYAIYSNGDISISNVSNAGRIFFGLGQTFTWTAYKK